MIDLSRLIEAGDFKQHPAAQDIIDQAMAPVPNERYRATMLYRVARELGQSAPELPESDALRRAIQSTVRRTDRAAVRPAQVDGRLGRGIVAG